MSGISEAFQAHLEGDVTTVCHCWRVTRSDGATLGFTDHDDQLTADGTVFEPQSGLTPSEAKQSLGLATDAADVEGALSSDAIDEADIAAGRYDGAKVETLLVNWRSPDQFALIRTAAIGRLRRIDGRFTAELESLSQTLDRPSGRRFARLCDAELGDARCGFDLETAGFSGGGAVIETDAIGAIRASGLAAFADGWFAHGVLDWTTGARAGLSDRVTAHRKRDGYSELTLWSERAGAVEAGDTFTIVAGCDKRFSTCKAKFANRLNFRGFPHLPGNDAAYGYAVDGGDFDGGALVP